MRIFLILGLSALLVSGTPKAAQSKPKKPQPVQMETLGQVFRLKNNTDRVAECVIRDPSGLFIRLYIRAKQKSGWIINPGPKGLWMCRPARDFI